MRKHNYSLLNTAPAPLLKPGADMPYGEFIDHTQALLQALDPELFSPGSPFRVKDLFMEHFTVRTLQVEFCHDVVNVNETKGLQEDVVESCLFLSGGTYTTTASQQQGVELRKGDQNMMYDPSNTFVHRLNAGQAIDLVHVVIDPHYYVTLLPDHEPWAARLKEKLLNKETILPTPAASAGGVQYQAIQNMLANPLSGSLGKIMLEANFLQFIALQLYALFSENQLVTVSAINHRDRAIMHAVKDHLSTTLADDHSLASLSRMFGISESKLVKDFRQVFGTTVFACLAELKMNHARILLTDHGLSVSEAAHKIGYKNPHHFSAAFSKKFGYYPSRLKR